MNERQIQLRVLDKKLLAIKPLVPVISKKTSWIKTLREAFGMTSSQLAARLGVTQSRVAKMEKNEENLKVSTLEKVAQSMNCTFVTLFVPNSSLEETVKNQATKKAREMLLKVNQNMALENQLSSSPEILSDMVEEFLQKNTKEIWN